MAVASPIPEFKGHWLTGVIAQRRKGALSFFMDMSALGEMVSFRVLWVQLYFINDPVLLKYVLADNAKNYWKGVAFEVFKPMMGKGLAISEGDFWKRQRRLAQPAFHKERIAGLLASMVDQTQKTLEAWQPKVNRGEGFDMHDEMITLTMSIVARALFSFDITQDAQQVTDTFTFIVKETSRRLMTFNPYIAYMPGQKAREYSAAIATLDKVVFKILEERRARPGNYTDLLQMFMDARDADNGESMNDRQLRDECMTMFVVGHETIATAMSWLWILLCRNPEAMAKVREEVTRVLGGRQPTIADMPNLDYTSRCFEEAMRIYPPLYELSRQAYGQDTINGVKIRKNDLIAFSPWAMHRNEKYWPDPERFDPDRFLPENVAKRPKLAYIPFGAGQRMCIGISFSMMEATAITAMVVQRFQMTLDEGQVIEPEPMITLRPKHGVKVHLADARP